MGYNAYMLDFNFKIAERNMTYARELLGSEYKGGDIVDALMDCGFGVERVDGGVDALWWEGDKYPSYIEDVLSKIAPAVEDDVGISISSARTPASGNFASRWAR